MLWPAIQNGSGGRAGQSRHHGAIIRCPRGGRPEKRAFRQRLAPRLQRRPAKRWLQGHEPECGGALFLRRKFRCMTDYFALLEQPRAPWLDPAGLKEAYHRQTLQTHPDTAAPDNPQGAFAELNEAYQVLQDPKRRLLHLLELEGQAPSSGNQTVPQELHDLFPAIGALAQRTNLFLERMKAASNALSRSLL